MMILEELDNDSILVTVDKNLEHGNIVDIKCREIEFDTNSEIRSILFQHSSRVLDFHLISSEYKVQPIIEFVKSHGYIVGRDDCINELKTFVQYRYYRDDDMMNIIVRKNDSVDSNSVNSDVFGNTIITFADNHKIKEILFLNVMDGIDISMLPEDEKELTKFVFYENYLDNIVTFKENLNTNSNNNEIET